MAKNKQNTPFKEFENQSQGRQVVQIVKKNHKALSKEQERFNRLTKRIEDLEKEIETSKGTLEDLLKFYNSEVEPINIQIARQKVRLAYLVEEKLLNTKFSKKTISQCEFLITYLLDDAFQTIEPTKEETALYDRFSEISFEDEKNRQIEELKEQMKSMFSEVFDINVDLSDLNMEDPENLARFQREMSEKLKEKQDERNEKSQNQKKKSKKQLAAELLERAKLEAQNKSLKSVYLSLSKAIHPDKETDTILKMEKEELMKRVTVAYKDKDFSTLLKLELEWVHKTSDKLNELSEEQLKIYNQLLEDRAIELFHSKDLLYKNPRFEPFSRYINIANKTAKTQLKKFKKIRKLHAENLKYNELIFHAMKDKTLLVAFINDFYNDLYEESIMNFFL